ncbi:Aste57867_2160 [Aphanomyces stellatus]|uniref:Aste57867_2160 protein n=1 Tax=Aphanomyces stellatus TaxID=120398 RepID=A0A485K713_9STRA|nr:hypothetical protein As57867_002155 [Aphanomyces stellatus]VFT79363.1 Aste57867_2160 [Aphanomyces stellatus]
MSTSLTPVADKNAVVDLVLEGNLSYHNAHNKPRTQWFALDGARHALLRYATSDRSKKPRGKPILLLGARIERQAQLEFVVHLQQPYHGLKKLTYVAATADDKEAWMRAMITCANGLASRISKRMRSRGVLNGQYVLVRELGRGASGTVYLYTYHGKPYAVKKMVAKATRLNKRVTDDVKREIALLKKASNLPHVVSLYDVIQGHDDGDVYLVMEFLGGGPITEYDKTTKRWVVPQTNDRSPQRRIPFRFMTKRPMVENDFKRLLRGAAIGLKYLHGLHLVHRDIKPDNILMTDDFSECKLADLGVAHWFEAAATSLNDHESPLEGRLRDTKGTYEFMAPEAISGDDYSGYGADVWALGVTLYALVVGVLPFQADNVLALFDAIGSAPLTFPANVVVSADVKDLITNMMAKNPKDRLSLAQVLQHPWLCTGATKDFLKHAKAPSSPEIILDDMDIRGAVSPLQLKFDMMRRATPAEQMVAIATLDTADPKAIDVVVDDQGSPVAKTRMYTPQPIAIEGIELPRALTSDVVTTMAHQLHFEWCFQKLVAGGRFGAERDDAAKVHPLLRPFWELDDAARARNRASVEASLKCIVALGYSVDRKSIKDHPTHTRKAPALPMSLNRIALSGELIVLGDLLAENDHEVWAHEYIQNGWTLGPVYDETTKQHPALVAFPDLSDAHRVSTRLGALNVLKSLVGLRFAVEHVHAKYNPTTFLSQRRMSQLVLAAAPSSKKAPTV